MRHLLTFLKHIGLALVLFSGTAGAVYFVDQKSWIALPAFLGVIALALLYQKITNKRRCRYCSSFSSPTGVGGNKYMQWYCKNCNNTFWTTLFWENYE